MPRHASNQERIANAAAAAEAKAAAKAAKAAEKAAAKAAKAALPKAPRVSKPRAPKAPQRMKIVWGVGPIGGVPASTYPYNNRAGADAEAAKKGANWCVSPHKVPMADGE